MSRLAEIKKEMLRLETEYWQLVAEQTKLQQEIRSEQNRRRRKEAKRRSELFWKYYPNGEKYLRS